MRDLSLNLRQAIFEQHASKTFLQLLTVRFDQFDPMYYVNDYVSHTSNDREFMPAAFTVALPDDDGETIPRVSLVFDAGDMQFIERVRSVETQPIVELEIALANDPNSIEIGPIVYEVKGYRVSGTTVQTDLSFEPILDEPSPSLRFTPLLFPGLYKNVTVQ